jgi:hypothetical protein
MKNGLTDLNNHLFAQIERLSDESIKGDALKVEIDRSKAVSDIASKIISNGQLVLNAAQFKADFSTRAILPDQFKGIGHDAK